MSFPPFENNFTNPADDLCPKDNNEKKNSNKNFCNCSSDQLNLNKQPENVFQSKNFIEDPENYKEKEKEKDPKIQMKKKINKLRKSKENKITKINKLRKSHENKNSFKHNNFNDVLKRVLINISKKSNFSDFCKPCNLTVRSWRDLEFILKYHKNKEANYKVLDKLEEGFKNKELELYCSKYKRKEDSDLLQKWKNELERIISDYKK